jgi:glycerophosphoryl diester phosphodiesterase
MRFVLLPVLACALWGQSPQVMVIAHRGEHLQHTENTIPAFRAAVDLGADFFEVDVRTTSDGRLVLMHDSRVDRTTNGHGEVAKMTFDEIRALEAGKDTRVPTLDEAMDVAGADKGVYLDCKSVAPQPLIDAIERHRLSERVVIYGNPTFLKEVLALRPKLRAMPEARNATVLKQLIESLHLKVAAFDAHDWTGDVIAVARAASIDLYVDRLGQADKPEIWQQAVDQGATGIQTDKPGELVQYLRARGYHK